MEISVPKPEKHHELAGGSVSWVNANGRKRIRRIRWILPGETPDTIILSVRKRREPQPELGTVFTLERKLFE